MAYSGWLCDPEYTRRGENETVRGEWVFENNITFQKVIRGTAIATYYADLAEYYKCNPEELLPKGTLVKFGGDAEITKTSKNDRNFFGVISSKPGVTLNHKDSDDYVPIALGGRIPCRVLGTVKKFAKLTTSHYPGVAKQKTLWDTICGKPTIGIALEDKDDILVQLIEIFVQAKIQ